VHRADGRVQIAVSDAGGGFDPAQLRAEGGPSEGFGLFSVSERLGLLGGRMEVDSAPGRGSRFTLVAPVSPPEGQETATAPIERQPKASVAVAAAERTSATDEGRIRLVLADDHLVMRQGLAVLLRQQPDMAVVGEVSDGDSVVRLVREARPDVVLMEVSLPGMDGLEATRIIHAEMPGVRVIGLSLFEETGLEDAMLAAGATTFLTKSGPSGRLLDAIRACVRQAPSRVEARPQIARTKTPGMKSKARTTAGPGSRPASKARASGRTTHGKRDR
jgi:DNA-binding NarL/FixJ family response regulator